MSLRNPAATGTLAKFEQKQRQIRPNVGEKSVQFRYHDGHSTHLEAVLSLGDRRVADAIEAAWRMGCKFDSWDEYFHYDTWMTAFESVNLDPYFIANRQKAYEEALPWDHIDCGVAKSYFKKEDRLSRDGKFTPDCHSAACTMCQACDRTVLDGIGKKLADKGSTLLPLEAYRPRGHHRTMATWEEIDADLCDFRHQWETVRPDAVTHMSRRSVAMIDRELRILGNRVVRGRSLESRGHRFLATLSLVRAMMSLRKIAATVDPFLS